MDEPVLRRKFILNDVDENHNKWYEICQMPNGDIISRWGRVGDAGQEKNYGKEGSWFIQKKIDEKTRKGYREIQLHKPTSVASTSVSKGSVIDQLIDWIFMEANEHISTYLQGTVDALSQRQIDEGRDHILMFSFDSPTTKREAIKQYYNTIPTQLPRKLDWDELINNFDPAEEEDRLNQLEAALSTFKATESGTSQYDALGAKVDAVIDGEAYRQIVKYFNDTQRGGQLQSIFSIEIPSDIARWDAEPRGKHSIASLWHGTRNPNIRHILKSGFRAPITNGHVANGSRFGRGIYFADKAQRSQNYTGARMSIPKMLLLTDVAVGTQIRLDNAPGPNYKLPTGYDSVWGTGSWGGVDEFVVFLAGQTKIRYLVTYR